MKVLPYVLGIGLIAVLCLIPIVGLFTGGAFNYTDSSSAKTSLNLKQLDGVWTIVKREPADHGAQYVIERIGATPVVRLSFTSDYVPGEFTKLQDPRALLVGDTLNLTFDAERAQRARSMNVWMNCVAITPVKLIPSKE